MALFHYRGQVGEQVCPNIAQQYSHLVCWFKRSLEKNESGLEVCYLCNPGQVICFTFNLVKMIQILVCRDDKIWTLNWNTSHT